MRCRFVVIITLLALCRNNIIVTSNKLQCDSVVSTALKSEIKSYQNVVNSIKSAVVDENGALKNSTWTKLANFVDDFGPRILGSSNLEEGIKFLLKELEIAKLDNVHGEDVTVTRWIRGNESATLTKPRMMKLPMLGLGGSIGTLDKNGITAEVIVVRSFEELKALSAKNVQGKIVVYNEEYISYGETVTYRSNGASEAAKVGAVATLIRSITPFPSGSPHTGQQHYQDNFIIPTACISVQHAEMLQRLYDRGIKLEINLKMDAHQESPVMSRNVVAEIKGKTKAEETVLISGHIDSWDVGQGAMDDGGGAFISWQSLVVLKTLGLQPRRTIRSVLWVGEEAGYFGVKAYLKKHFDDIKKLKIVMESDEGTFTPTGLIFKGSTEAACILQDILNLMEPLNATTLEISEVEVGSDITVFQKYHVNAASLKNKNERYFWYHHSEDDTMSVENPHDLDLCTAFWAAVSYIIADLSESLPSFLPPHYVLKYVD